jgi:glycosyltransferase involved in cell wall biosynthesis
MKILKICTSKSGGASIAAIRQQEALNKQPNIHCDLLTADIIEDYSSEIKVKRNENHIEICIPVIYWDQFGVLNNALIEANRTEISNTWFSYSLYKTDWDDHIFNLTKEYDVIHLHWVTQLISLDLINRIKAEGKKIAITSHDENYYTGGCHYTAGCTRFLSGCNDCIQLKKDELATTAVSLENKQLTLSSSGINWIFPSKWLMQQFEKSKINSGFENAIVVRNTIDIQVYNVANAESKSELRKHLGIGDKDIVIVSGAQDNKEIRKGFIYADHAIKAIRLKNIESSAPLNIKVISFGHGGVLPNGFGVKHIHLGFIGQEEIIKVLQIADLLLFTSIEENFSNLILEALACGCPVLGFEIGGIPDIVQNNVNGALVDSIDQNSYTDKAIEIVFGDLVKLRKSTEKWRNQEFFHYENTVIANQLIEIYKESKPSVYNSNLEDKYKFKGMLTIDFSYPLIDSVVVGEQIKKINNKLLDAIYKGFVDYELHHEYGRVAWIKTYANSILRRDQYLSPVLVIVCPYAQWNWFNIDVAEKNIRSLVDGNAEVVELIKDESKKYCAFLIDASKVKNTSNFIDIDIYFKEPTVPFESDSRGLCLLYCDVLILNKRSLDECETAVKKISYIESVAIKRQQTWQVNNYLDYSKNKHEELNKKIFMATDLLLLKDN